MDYKYYKHKPRTEEKNMRMKITKNEWKTYSIEYYCNLGRQANRGKRDNSKCMTNRIVFFVIQCNIIVISVSNIYVPTSSHVQKKTIKSKQMHPHLDSKVHIHTHFSSNKCSLKPITCSLWGRFRESQTQKTAVSWGC